MSYVQTTCFLCERPLEPLNERYQTHPLTDPDGSVVEDCLVTITDMFGIAVDIDNQTIVVADEPRASFEIEVAMFPTVESVLTEIFKEHGLQRLGGVSSGRGWSSFSVWQRCAMAYKKRYLEPRPSVDGFGNVEAPALAVGTVIHVLLAVYYQRMISPDYPLTPGIIHEKLMQRANPAIVQEAWRVFQQYALYYQNENIQPLGVELDLIDPRTRESCRFDLVAFYPETIHDRLAGTYILEHKSASRFDDATLNGWVNDGEVLGQVMLWERLGLSKRYGPLRGVIINILGKQKEPRFHRTTVSPSSMMLEQHRDDLKQHEAQIHMAKTTGVFPRSRGNCIGRYGKCDYWYDCAGDLT